MSYPVHQSPFNVPVNVSKSGVIEIPDLDDKVRYRITDVFLTVTATVDLTMKAKGSVAGEEHFILIAASTVLPLNLVGMEVPLRAPVRRDTSDGDRGKLVLNLSPSDDTVNVRGFISGFLVKEP